MLSKEYTIQSSKINIDTFDEEFFTEPHNIEVEIVSVKVDNEFDIFLSVVLLTTSLLMALLIAKTIYSNKRKIVKNDK